MIGAAGSMSFCSPTTPPRASVFPSHRMCIEVAGVDFRAASNAHDSTARGPATATSRPSKPSKATLSASRMETSWPARPDSSSVPAPTTAMRSLRLCELNRRSVSRRLATSKLRPTAPALTEKPGLRMKREKLTPWTPISDAKLSRIAAKRILRPIVKLRPMAAEEAPTSRPVACVACVSVQRQPWSTILSTTGEKRRRKGRKRA
eukprot:scaffold1435_cov267-Pinguiococcus_pyrenoidosus.AAC.50